MAAMCQMLTKEARGENNEENYWFNTSSDDGYDI